MTAPLRRSLATPNRRSILRRAIRFAATNPTIAKWARRGLEMLSYEAASSAARVSGWTSVALGPRSEISIARPRMVGRARDLAQNNPFARKACAEWVDHLVGHGIKPRATTEFPEINATVDAIWEDWADECYSGSRLGLYGIQRICARAWWTDGEALVRLRPRLLSDGLPIPLQLEVLESDYLDATKIEALASGGRIVNGVEFNAIGQIVAYWIYREHPADSIATWATPTQSVRVLADRVCHLYEEARPGAVRGVPFAHASMIRAWDYDGYRDSALAAKANESLIVGTVSGLEAGQGLSRKDSAGNVITYPAVTGADGSVYESLQPGSLLFAPDGANLAIHQPTSTPGFREFCKELLHDVSAGFLTPYELVSGDLEGVNYSSIKFGLRSYLLRVRAMRETHFIPLVMRPIWQAFSWYLVALGIVPESALDPDGGLPVQWSAPEYEPIDRAKEATADSTAIANRTHSRVELIAARGRDWRQVIDEEAEFAAYLAERGLGDSAPPPAPVESMDED